MRVQFFECWNICSFDQWREYVFFLVDLWFSTSAGTNLLESSLKHRPPGIVLGVSVSVGLVWDPRIRLSNKFPGDANDAGLGNALWELLVFMKNELKYKGDLLKLQIISSFTWNQATSLYKLHFRGEKGDFLCRIWTRFTFLQCYSRKDGVHICTILCEWKYLGCYVLPTTV